MVYNKVHNMHIFYVCILYNNKSKTYVFPDLIKAFDTFNHNKFYSVNYNTMLRLKPLAL